MPFHLPRPRCLASVLLIVIAALSLSVIAVAAESGAHGTALMPHRANYLLSLAPGGEEGGISDARGVMSFEVAEACDGWTMAHRMRLTVVSRSGNEVEMESDFSSWETKDGTLFRFESRSRHNGRVIEELSGRATISEPGRGGQATFTAPKETTVALPPGTIFPTAHTQLLLRRAAAGKPVTWRLVFDGTTADGVYGVNAFVTAAMSAQTNAPLPHFSGRPSWRVKLAYFDEGEDSAEPTYEIAMRINDTGISDELVLDYGRFSLNATLKEIEALPKPDC